MNYLAITAELKSCSIAFQYEGMSFCIDENLDTASTLPQFLSDQIKSHNIDLRKIDKIVTTAGPGSFTGLRAAQSLCKGISLALNIPAYSIDYFDLMLLMRHISVSDTQKIISVIKNIREQFYYKLFPEKIYGVAKSADLCHLIDVNTILIGEDLDKFCNAKQGFHCSDFRSAKNLTKFADNI